MSGFVQHALPTFADNPIPHGPRKAEQAGERVSIMKRIAGSREDGASVGLTQPRKLMMGPGAPDTVASVIDEDTKETKPSSQEFTGYAGFGSSTVRDARRRYSILGSGSKSNSLLGGS